MELDHLKIKMSDGYMYGGDQSLFGKRSLRSGCGMIAACDLILYSKGKRFIDFSEYAAFVRKFRDEKAYFHSRNLIGIFPRKLVKLINSELSAEKVRFMSRRKFTAESLQKFIYSSILADKPVIVRVGLNGKKFPYGITFPARGGNSRRGKTDWHYITVTGISDSGKIIFSSWGGRGESSCKMLYRYFGITGGVIADKNIEVPPKN